MSDVDTQSIIAPADFAPYWAEDLPEEKYHDDKTAVGSSSLRLMLDSPKSFYQGFYLKKHKEPSDAMKLGKLIHMALLEGTKFKERYQIIPRFTGKTQKGEETDSLNCKEVKEKRDAWFKALPKDAVVCTEGERESIVGIIDSCMAHPDIPKLFTKGRPEVSGFYRDPKTGIRCKVRPDFLTFNSALFSELKSTRSSEARKFGGDTFDKRYDFQLAMYRIGIKAISGIVPEIVPLIAVEPLWPYECAVYYFEEDDLRQAEHDYEYCLWRLAECLKSGKWPQRQERLERIYTPNWFMAKMNDDLTIQEMQNV